MQYKISVAGNYLLKTNTFCVGDVWVTESKVCGGVIKTPRSCRYKTLYNQNSLPF